MDLGLDGLASGFPTADVIEQLVELERKPIENLEEEKVELKSEQDAWRDVNSRIKNLSDTLTQLKLSSTYNSNSANSSNEEVATASADKTASPGIYELTVNNTARAHRLSGIQLANTDTVFKDEFGSFPTTGEVMINGQGFEITEDDTLQSLRDSINNDLTGVNASIVDNRLVLESSETGAENQLGIIDDNDIMETLGILTAGADDSVLTTASRDVADADTELGLVGSFAINIEDADGNILETAEIEVAAEDSLNELADKINNSGLTVTAASVSGTSLELDNSAGNAIKLANTGADGEDNIIDSLRFGNQSYDSELQTARDAEIEVNGITGITSSSNSFTEVVDGVTFNIDSSAESGDTASVTVTQDTEKAVSAVQGFVEQYNSTMDYINGKLDYDPETEKAGALQGNGTLMRVQMRLRNMITDRVDSDSDYDHLAAVGISIDRDGVMSLDSGELTSALEDEPEAVMDLFTAKNDDEGFDGIAVQLDNYVDQLIQSNTGVIPRQVDFYDTRMDNIDDSIESHERRLESTRQRYVEQFTAMEEAISEMQQQGNWLMSQLDNMSGSTSMLGGMSQ